MPILLRAAAPAAVGAAVIGLIAALVAQAAAQPPAVARTSAREQLARASVFLPLSLSGMAGEQQLPPPSATKTPWIPATADPLCATPTPPGPTATAFPTVTLLPPGRRERPPVLRLVTAATTVTAALGTFCWNGGCADTFALVTPSESLVVRSPLSGRLILAASVAPAKVVLTVYDVTGLEPTSKRPDTWQWNETRGGSSYTLEPRRDNDITIARLPGRYIVHISADWDGDGITAPDGDAYYGFLVEVQP